MPVKDIYDTQMMLASVNAAKDMYEKGIEEMKEFRKEYGDFYSPIQSDMDWYSKEVLSPVRDTINNLYAAGIDPLRSPEGRAAISKAINSINIGAVNQKKRDAENAALYIKSRNEAMKNNTWNPDYERAMLGGQLLEEWDGSLGNWTATSVSPYLDYEQKYGHLFDKMGYEYDPEESKKHPGMLVSTKNKDRMRAILSASRPDLINDPQYQYDLNRLKDALKITNPNASDEELTALATTAIENEIVERNYKGGMQMVEDPIARENRSFQHQLVLEDRRHEHELIEKQTPSAKSSSSSSSGSGSGGSGAPAIFREAASRLPQSQGPLLKGIGESVGYGVFDEPHYQWMDPVGTGIREVKSQKGGNFGYFIPASQLNKVYRSEEYNQDGSKVRATADISGRDTYFIPSGQMHAERDDYGTIRYYISGALLSGTGDDAYQIGLYGVGSAGGSRTYEIEVTERAFNYAKKQASTNSPFN